MILVYREQNPEYMFNRYAPRFINEESYLISDISEIRTIAENRGLSIVRQLDVIEANYSNYPSPITVASSPFKSRFLQCVPPNFGKQEE